MTVNIKNWMERNLGGGHGWLVVRTQQKERKTDGNHIY